eukprot:gnl/TRDRNA2_/TRDRNA2_174215_c0_seq6.p1 gnl/TRDRNA2_/TRDRNA2_174215_c0~~gnl/TRDRNA2_/TRDRNA2_174215_c0_seq6.p1  ORF type:complete len:417 (-),score=77.86 gnl/TRDRNA2_/TRDRNA2_174215_c0_seq6:922-2118(-)
MAAASTLTMRVKNTFIDFQVEDFSDEFSNGFGYTGPGCVPRQMSEPALSPTKRHMSTFKYELEAIATSDTLPRAELHTPVHSSSMSVASDSDTESTSEHRKNGYKKMLEDDCWDVAGRGEMRMERQVIDEESKYQWDYRAPAETTELYPLSTQVCMLPQGCVVLPMQMVQVLAPEAADATVTSSVNTLSDEWAEVHTIMMRNVPNRYTQHLLIEELNNRGFLGAFDFVYLPVDAQTDANRGYAFINFDQASDARRFKEEFDGYQMSYFESSKFVTVTPATLQGFEANYAHYANSRVNRGDPAKRPIFLREPQMTPGKSKRSGRRHGRSMIDVALRAKDRKAAVVKAAMQGAVTEYSPSVDAADGATVQSTASKKFCASCGGKRLHGDKFCAFCGSALA